MRSKARSFEMDTPGDKEEPRKPTISIERNPKKRTLLVTTGGLFAGCQVITIRAVASIPEDRTPAGL